MRWGIAIAVVVGIMPCPALGQVGSPTFSIIDISLNAPECGDFTIFLQGEDEVGTQVIILIPLLAGESQAEVALGDILVGGVPTLELDCVLEEGTPEARLQCFLAQGLTDLPPEGSLPGNGDELSCIMSHVVLNYPDLSGLRQAIDCLNLATLDVDGSCTATAEQLNDCLCSPGLCCEDGPGGGDPGAAVPLDTDGDGEFDCYDLDGDGECDCSNVDPVTGELDPPGECVPMNAVGVDRDGDGIVDCWDTTGDGECDCFEFDAAGSCTCTCDKEEDPSCGCGNGNSGSGSGSDPNDPGGSGDDPTVQDPFPGIDETLQECGCDLSQWFSGKLLVWEEIFARKFGVLVPTIGFANYVTAINLPIPGNGTVPVGWSFDWQNQVNVWLSPGWVTMLASWQFTLRLMFLLMVGYYFLAKVWTAIRQY